MLYSILVVPMKNGQEYTFIPHDELLRGGYVNIEDFMVVECNGRFFELQGFDHKAGLWWVEEIVVPPGQEEDAGRSMEAMGEGGSEGPWGNPLGSSGE